MCHACTSFVLTSASRSSSFGEETLRRIIGGTFVLSRTCGPLLVLLSCRSQLHDAFLTALMPALTRATTCRRSACVDLSLRTSFLSFKVLSSISPCSALVLFSPSLYFRGGCSSLSNGPWPRPFVAGGCKPRCHGRLCIRCVHSPIKSCWYEAMLPFIAFILCGL